MKLLLATDAWHPQVNGVVTTIGKLLELLPTRDVAVRVITPADFRRIAFPWYPEIEIALPTRSAIRRAFDEFEPDAVHIFTEATIGWAVRRECLRRGIPFTTSYHTRYPEYVRAWTGLPVRFSYPVLRRFHNAGRGCMVSTASLRKELRLTGFKHIRRWTRGVDRALFHPRPGLSTDLPGPVFLYVGRVSIEKNIEAFLSLDLPGSKVVVGDGPDLARLQARYPQAVFKGKLRGEILAEAYCKADVFVFPSRTDTFGVVLLEAMACGIPIAAYPVTGPIDVVTSDTGRLDNDLRTVALAAAAMPKRAEANAEVFSWDQCVDQFIDNLEVKGRVGALSAAQRMAPRRSSKIVLKT